MIETIILLKPRQQWRPGVTKQQIIADLDHQLQIPGVRNGWTQPIINRINMLATGVRTDLGVKIYGDNIDTLEASAIRAERILRGISGAADVAADRIQGGVFLDITVDEPAAARHGISVADVQMLIETAIGGETVGQVIEGRARYSLRVRYERELRDNIEAIGEVLVPIRAGNAPLPGPWEQAATSEQVAMSNAPKAADGMAMGGSSTMGASAGATAMAATGSFGAPPSQGYVRLGDIAHIRMTPGASMLASENGQLRSVVFLNVRGRDMGSFVQEAQEVLQKQLDLPKGYTVEWSGQYENKLRAEQRLMLVVPIVFLVIFLMLYMTMHDWKEAGVVMLSVPFALVGGVYLLYALGYNFSVAVWVGFIALYGVAVQTGVVMVVYLHHALDAKLKSGQTLTAQGLYEAVMDGAVQRLRPKLMTVATSMLGLVPIMFATGVGSDVMKPLVAPMIGGLLTSAVHVLIMTPVLFVIMKERAWKKGRLQASQMAEWMA